MTLIPLREAAAQLGVAPSTLRHQIRLKRLAAQRVGPDWHVTPDEISRYRREVQGKTA